MKTKPAETKNQAALARSDMYKIFGKALQYPTRNLIERIVLRMETAYGNDANFDGIRTFLQHEGSVEVLEAEYNRLFAHIGSAQCPPYETEYGHENVFQKTEAMADIAGFYTAFGLEIRTSTADRVDFISTECEFMSYLALHEAYALERGEEEHLEVCLDAQRKFVQDHTGRWVPVFSQILLKATTNPFYLWVAQQLAKFIDADCRHLDVTPTIATHRSQHQAVSTEPFNCEGCMVASEPRKELTDG